MVAALHAQRILQAWDTTASDRRNTGLFNIELDEALIACQTVPPFSTIENEQKDVLRSVAQRLRSNTNASSYQVEAGLTLLKHLSTRIN